MIAVLFCYGDESAKNEADNLAVDLSAYPQLWLRAVGNDGTNEVPVQVVAMSYFLR